MFSQHLPPSTSACWARPKKIMRTPTPVLFRPKDSQTDSTAMVSQRVVLVAGSCAGWISVGLKGLSSLLPLNFLHIPLARQAGRGRHLYWRGWEVDTPVYNPPQREWCSSVFLFSLVACLHHSRPNLFNFGDSWGFVLFNSFKGYPERTHFFFLFIPLS